MAEATFLNVSTSAISKTEVKGPIVSANWFATDLSALIYWFLVFSEYSSPFAFGRRASQSLKAASLSTEVSSASTVFS